MYTPQVYIQWKGTDVCLDWHCDCGAFGHFDGHFAYNIKCPSCGRFFQLPEHLAVTPLSEEPELYVEPEL